MAKYIATQDFRDKNNFDNYFKKGDPIGNKLSKERIEELTKKGFIKESAEESDDKPAAKSEPAKSIGKKHD